MGSKTVKTCDLCAGQIRKDERSARLVVPVLTAAHADGEQDYLQQSLSRMFGAILIEQQGYGERVYDICLGCVTGLLTLSDVHRAAIERERR